MSCSLATGPPNQLDPLNPCTSPNGLQPRREGTGAHLTGHFAGSPENRPQPQPSSMTGMRQLGRSDKPRSRWGYVHFFARWMGNDEFPNPGPPPRNPFGARPAPIGTVSTDEEQVTLTCLEGGHEKTTSTFVAGPTCWQGRKAGVVMATAVLNCSFTAAAYHLCQKLIIILSICPRVHSWLDLQFANDAMPPSGGASMWMCARIHTQSIRSTCSHQVSVYAAK
ncbi:unnamed protein product [Protopolystoma xenopodis]|uniref:Uncharacterized protein n=1 Tax=Protopolystoma xenopodis TaxID=117903 RepID=A0A3S5A344_9PLAT|nr:unnamed protein product [Protopolystoma xenopodis]